MTQVTSDLEYFKCDMCGKYLHRDIFCPHRRECKGADSVELTRTQADAVAAAMDRADGKLRARCEGGPAVPIETLAKLQTTRTRAQLAAEYEKEVDKEIEAKLKACSVDDVLAELAE